MHDHELLGTVEVAVGNGISHTHRFATVTGPPIPYNNSHVHDVSFRTDSAGHYHEFSGRTGFAIMVSSRDHVHFINSVTTTVAGHSHQFEAATLIQNPLELLIQSAGVEACNNVQYLNSAQTFSAETYCAQQIDMTAEQY